jgi:hypothetical protein
MRNCALSLLSIVLGCSGNSQAQSPARSPRTTSRIRTEPEITPRVIINPVFATGMVCDGVTDDSAALRTALASAANPSLGNATVIMPPGTCIIDPGASVSINASIWLQGAGRFGTTLKRKNSSSGATILLIGSNGVTLSDFAIDGNKGGPGIASSADSVAATSPFAAITILRMRFANSTNSDIASYVTGAGNYTTDWLIEDNDFENQGNPFSSCIASIRCANLRLLQPLRLRIIGNNSNNSQQFALFGSIPGGGQVEVGQNTINNLDGFAVALGGGVLGSAGAHIHHNFISSTNTNVDNLLDLAFWSDFTIDHNVLYHNGVPTSDDGLAIGCVGDFPPANHGEVDSNICYIAPNTIINVVGIGLGGSDVSVTNNFVQGASSAGISIAISNLAPSRGVRIIGNTAKNNNQNPTGAHAGIELYLGVGGTGLSGLTDVIIQGNHSYDDQPTKTQSFGIGVGLYGQRSGFADITIEGNNVIGNKTGGILNNALPFTGFVIRNNAGHNPVGPITAPDFPMSGAGPQMNNTGYDVTVYITSGTQPITIAINGTTLTGVLVPGGGVVSGPIRLPANQSITLTYTGGGTPSWQWVAE